VKKKEDRRQHTEDSREKVKGEKGMLEYWKNGRMGKQGKRQ
jgi:hypothetical protein